MNNTLRSTSGSFTDDSVSNSCRQINAAAKSIYEVPVSGAVHVQTLLRTCSRLHTSKYLDSLPCTTYSASVLGIGIELPIPNRDRLFFQRSPKRSRSAIFCRSSKELIAIDFSDDFKHCRAYRAYSAYTHALAWRKHTTFTALPVDRTRVLGVRQFMQWCGGKRRDNRHASP